MVAGFAAQVLFTDRQGSGLFRCSKKIFTRDYHGLPGSVY
jgi:hypothetical protein